LSTTPNSHAVPPFLTSLEFVKSPNYKQLQKFQPATHVSS
jgi:hypothetical protein